MNYIQLSSMNICYIQFGSTIINNILFKSIIIDYLFNYNRLYPIIINFKSIVIDL